MKIYPLDLNFMDHPRTIAAYLVIGPEAPVLVETGPSSTLGTLHARLAEYGVAPADIQHLFVTHIHLDHAGAAGWWAQQGTNVYVHHVGASHLIDPSRLLASAKRIYGDAMDKLWGETLPAPAEQVHPLYDGDTVLAGGLAFTALDTPGHARHHHTYRLHDIAFTGDAAGVRLPHCSFLSLPAPPPEFDPTAWVDSVRRLRSERLAALYPTHFGAVKDVNAHLAALADLIDESAEYVRLQMGVGMERGALTDEYLDWVRQRAGADGLDDDTFQAYEAANPSFMSVDGIMRYWRKQSQN